MEFDGATGNTVSTPHYDLLDVGDEADQPTVMNSEDHVRNNLKNLSNKLRATNSVHAIIDDSAAGSEGVRRREPKPSTWPEPYLLNEPLPMIEDASDCNLKETFHLTFVDTDEAVLSNAKRSHMLSVYVITWNMHGKLPPDSVDDILPRNKYHIYAIGTQECERGIAASFINPSKNRWISLVTATLGDHYSLLASRTLQAMNLILFVHKALIPISSSSVATGIADRMGNKGGVGISVTIGTSNLLFINSHFSAFVRRRLYPPPLQQEKVMERNLDYERISTELNLGEEEGRVENSFHHCLWLGDLNYRVNGSREMVDRLLRENLHEVLLANEQLLVNKRRERTMIDFNEAPLNFRPTYKFDSDGVTYDSSVKQRIPSWTDRILWKSRKDIKCFTYNSIPEVNSSDHKPVFAVFNLQWGGANYYSVMAPKIGSAHSEVCSIQ